MNHPNPLCPFTLFDHEDEDRSDRSIEASFFGLVEVISDIAGERFDTESGPWLLAPCEFREGIRGADHVVRSGLVMLEVRRGLTLDDINELLGGNGLAGFIYTAASLSDRQEAFRIGIPLSQTVTAATYTRTWTAMNRLFVSTEDEL